MGLTPIAKFMLSVRDGSFQRISSEASGRGISVQELLRAVILPEWIRENVKQSSLSQPVREVATRLTRPSMLSDQGAPILRVPLARPRTLTR